MEDCPSGEDLARMSAEEVCETLRPLVQKFLDSNPDRRELQGGYISLRERIVRVVTRKNYLTVYAEGIPNAKEALKRIEATLEELMRIVKWFEHEVRERSIVFDLLEYPENARLEARQILRDQCDWLGVMAESETRTYRHALAHLQQLKEATDMARETRSLDVLQDLAEMLRQAEEHEAELRPKYQTLLREEERITGHFQRRLDELRTEGSSHSESAS